MTEELKLENKVDPNSYIPQDPTQTKKKSGCGCFLVGCLIVLALVFLPIIGGGVYIMSLSNAEWGAKVVQLLKYPGVAEGFKESINNNEDLTKEQKQALINLYKKFLTEYDNLPKDKQDTINKNIFVVIKKVMTNPKEFEKQPPKEFLEIVTILGSSELALDDIKQKLDQITKTQNPTDPAQKTTDPYNFDLPNNNQSNQNTAPTTPKKKDYETDYDF